MLARAVDALVRGRGRVRVGVRVGVRGRVRVRVRVSRAVGALVRPRAATVW